MLRFAANLSMLFTEVDFLSRFAQAKEHNFHAVEFLFPYAHPPATLQEIITEHELHIELFNLPPGDWEAGERGLAAVAGRENEFRESVEQALEYAQVLGVHKLHCMAGLKEPNGGQQIERYRENLAYAAAKAADQGIRLLIEPLNPYSVPNYVLDDYFQASSIITDIDNLFLQFDVFHCQLLHGQIAHLLKKFASITGHYQIAGVPERYEPNVGELNYAYIFQVIDSVGYGGAIGCEYIPQGATVDGLCWRAAAE